MFAAKWLQLRLWWRNSWNISTDWGEKITKALSNIGAVSIILYAKVHWTDVIWILITLMYIAIWIVEHLWKSKQRNRDITPINTMKSYKYYDGENHKASTFPANWLLIISFVRFLNPFFLFSEDYWNGFMEAFCNKMFKSNADRLFITNCFDREI